MSGAYEHKHDPVMLMETMEGLIVNERGCYIDATFGRGGHSRAVLARLSAEGRLHVYDRDPEAIAAAQVLAQEDARVCVHDAPNSQVRVDMETAGLMGEIDGLLLDLGVSSPQLDQAERGFSFLHDGPLDMRMDPRQGEPVSSWLQVVNESELADVLYHYGQERFSRRIAKAIVTRRAQDLLTRTSQLAQWVADAVPKREPNKHPATRTFLALRLWVNDESKHLGQLLTDSVEVLKPGGRLVVLTFHSQETQVLKAALRPFLPGHEDQPVWANPYQTPKPPRLRRVGRAQAPSSLEVKRNPRARSAFCRVWEKVA